MKGGLLEAFTLVGCTLVAACGQEPGLQGGLDAGGPLRDPLGVDGLTQVDRIVQPGLPVLDLLFVIDDSCSMGEEQIRLASNFAPMWDSLNASEADWHLGVVTTDMDALARSGRLVSTFDQRWITSDMIDAESTFARLVSVGTNGSPTEQGRAAAYAALEFHDQGHNAGFRRPDAGLHITVVSDEADFSYASPISHADWIAYLLQQSARGYGVSFSSVVPPRLGCPDVATVGDTYRDVTQRVGGVFWPVCKEPWSTMMDQVADQAIGPTGIIYLSRTPVVATLEARVTRDTVVVANVGVDALEYAPGPNHVRFLDVDLEPYDVVEVTYTVAAGP